MHLAYTLFWQENGLFLMVLISFKEPYEMSIALGARP